MNTNSDVLEAMKNAAWLRAKAELLSIGYMSYSTAKSHTEHLQRTKAFDDWDTEVDRFISKVESEELFNFNR